MPMIRTSTSKTALLVALLGAQYLWHVSGALALPQSLPLDAWLSRASAQKQPTLHAALALAHEGKQPEAIKGYEAILKRSPSDSDALFFLALSQERSGKIEQGLQTVDEALWFSKFNLVRMEDVLTEKARLLAIRGDNAKGAALATQVVAKRPDSLRARCVLSSAVLAQGNRSEALKVLREAPEAQRKDPELKFALAQTLVQGAHRNLNRDELEEAVRLLDTLSSAPRLDQKEVLLTSIKARMNVGRLEEAHALLREARTRFPSASDWASLEKQLKIEQGAHERLSARS